MNMVSRSTAKELVPIIIRLYDQLFDPNKKFSALADFSDLTDFGITKFKGVSNVRKLGFKFLGKSYEIGLFSYIRDNDDNALAIRNGESDSNFIQLVLDKFIRLEDSQFQITHDGVTTGTSGKTKKACIDYIERHAPDLVESDGGKRIVALGTLSNDFKFEDEAFKKFISSFIRYAILRNDFKNDIAGQSILNFRQLVEAYTVHLEEKDEITERFSVRDCTKNYVWIDDKINGFNDLECHYELITRDQKTFGIEIHFEQGRKNQYIKELDKYMPSDAIWTKHGAGKSIGYKNGYDFNEPNVFEKIDAALLYLNEHLGDRIRKIKTAVYSIQEIETFFKYYLKNVIPGSASLYFSCIPKISAVAKELTLVEESLFEIQDEQLLSQFKKAVSAHPDYLEMNKRSHNAQSSALKKYREFINGLSTSPNKEQLNDEPMSLNQILYGPPGTGKTYNTINKALEIIGDDIKSMLRKDVKDLFDKRVKEGQIVFTTFHQNMSYEDFIEGIKPKTNFDNQVTYSVEDGIFKKLCNMASEKRTAKNFDESYLAFIEDVMDKGFIDLKTPTHKKPFKVKINSNETAVAIPDTEKGTNMGVTKAMIKDYIINDTIRDWKPYTTSIGDYIKEKYPVIIETSDNAKKKFVIIIDEINRGNVSKIFGELITLIEESKRDGKPEAITAKLQYSKNEFSVPDNVYILGTMNTADRSVESLDTALRRRFDFIEMMPNYELFKKNDVRYFLNNMFVFDILKTINDRIEVLLGRDHLIGHSFFILDEGEKMDNKMFAAFYKNIIPLLQEYFYGDYNKIGLVLGSGFVEKRRVDHAQVLFADSSVFSGNDYIGSDNSVFSIKTHLKDDGTPDFALFWKALDRLMNKTEVLEDSDN